MSEETSTTRVTEFEDGSKIVTTETVESEFVEPGETSELETEVAAEAIEPVVDAAVEIARIEADRDITIAAIQSETTQAVVEAEADQGDDQWRQNTESRLLAMQETLDLLALVLTPPQSQEPEANPQSPAPESGEVTPGSPEVEAQSAPEPPKRPKKSRWI